jgi:hypothetical protein
VHRALLIFRISEIERLLQENIIRRSEEHLQDLIKNHQLSAIFISIVAMTTSR